MPPKTSNTHHVTFHFYKSAVMLSVPSSTSIKSLKTQLLAAFQPLSSTLPVEIPKAPSDIQLWETRAAVEGREGDDSLRCLEEDGGELGKTIIQLGWPRWKTLFVSFKGADGSFGQPIYTVPDVEDEEPEEVA
ncbi:hypothetical protein IAU60_004669 [Kwoniella sp. DSM 27419]